MMRIRWETFSQMRALRVAGPSWDFAVGSEKKMEGGGEEEEEKAEWKKWKEQGTEKVTS